MNKFEVRLGLKKIDVRLNYLFVGVKVVMKFVTFSFPRQRWDNVCNQNVVSKKFDVKFKCKLILSAATHRNFINTVRQNPHR